jgi:hypothetical protein
LTDPIVTWTNANGTTGAAGLDVALASYAGLKSSFKPSAATVVKVKQLLENIKFSEKYSKTPCVLAAWLGGAADITTFALGNAGDSGTAQVVCDVDPTFGFWYHGVEWYLDALAAVAPASAQLIGAAGKATAKEAAKAADKDASEAISKTIDTAKDTAKELVDDVVDTVGTGLKFASFGVGTALVLLAVVAFFIYAPKGRK